MTGKRYYLTTLGDWQRHAARFVNSHFVVLDTPAVDEAAALPPDTGAASSAPTTGPCATPSRDAAPISATTSILALIEADEGTHLALEDDTAFEALPHPLTQKPISDRAHAALAAHGVASGSTTFDAAEALARVHPLLRHRVF